MACPPRLLRLTAFAVLASAGLHAEPIDAAAPRRERALSPRLSSALSASLPKFEPAKTNAPASAAPAPSGEQPRNTIVRLPSYIVRDKRLPSPEDLLTKKGWEEDAASRYLGPKDSLDRALNAVTLTDMWKAIPVLGKIPFVPFNSLSNGERAQKIYERVERKRRWQELLDLGTIAPEKKP